MQKKVPCFRLIDKSGIKYSIRFYYDEIKEIEERINEGSNANSSWRYIEKTPIIKTIYDFNTLVLAADKVKLIKIYRDGKICPINDATTNKPVVELLLRFFDNPQKRIRLLLY